MSLRAFKRVLAVCALATLFANGSATSRDDSGWVSIFNGKDLTGWTPKIRGYKLGDNFGNTFRVTNGVIEVNYDGYNGEFKERFGHLFYKSPYSKYRFKCDYRFKSQQIADGPGWAWRNSGVMIHGQDPATMDLDQDFPVSSEVQLLGKDAGQDRTTGNLCTPGTNVVMDGKLITQHCTNSSVQSIAGDEWATLEIVVDGNGVVEHIINGVSALKYEKVQYDPKDASAQKLIKDGQLMISGGSISLQSESHPVEFRNIMIKPVQ